MDLLIHTTVRGLETLIKSVNYMNHEQILLLYQSSIRHKTACTYTYKKYANSLTNTFLALRQTH